MTTGASAKHDADNTSPTASVSHRGALKDAALAALVAFGLFSLLIGLRTDQGPTGALIVIDALRAARAPGRRGVRRQLPARARLRRGADRHSAARCRRVACTGVDAAPAVSSAPALLVFALLCRSLFYDNRYLLDLGILVLTYVMLGWGLNIVVGLAGLLDLGYVAFYAVGAYSYALLAQNFGLSFWICLPLAGILAAFWGVLLGFPVLRLRGDYLAIVTLAFGEIIRLVLINWQSFTGGPNGIASIPRPSFFGLPFTDERRRLRRDASGSNSRRPTASSFSST